MRNKPTLLLHENKHTHNYIETDLVMNIFFSGSYCVSTDPIKCFSPILPDSTFWKHDLFILKYFLCSTALWHESQALCLKQIGTLELKCFNGQCA